MQSTTQQQVWAAEAHHENAPSDHAVARRRDWHRLIFNTGYIISTTGAAGTLLAYLIGALVVWLVMQCLGELSVAMPETGAFHVYAARYLGPATELYRGVALLANVDGGAGFELHRGGFLHAVLVPAGSGLDLVRGVLRGDLRP
ncbi:hypothetical protein LNP26_05180 [Klebsiella variicola subsp. variicola]|nr:hypothetical protein [Klebsiella variicola subsp. variicola]